MIVKRMINKDKTIYEKGCFSKMIIFGLGRNHLRKNKKE